LKTPPYLLVSAKIALDLEQGIKTHLKVFVGSFVGKRGYENPQVID
jgi:hypothetical protein